MVGPFLCVALIVRILIIFRPLTESCIFLLNITGCDVCTLKNACASCEVPFSMKATDENAKACPDLSHVIQVLCRQATGITLAKLYLGTVHDATRIVLGSHAGSTHCPPVLFGQESPSQPIHLSHNIVFAIGTTAKDTAKSPYPPKGIIDLRSSLSLAASKRSNGVGAQEGLAMNQDH